MIHQGKYSQHDNINEIKPDRYLEIRGIQDLI